VDTGFPEANAKHLSEIMLNQKEPGYPDSRRTGSGMNVAPPKRYYWLTADRSEP